MARVTLSEGQSRFLFWLIVVIFSAVIALISYNLYLKWQLKNVRVEIVEIKPVEVNIPEELKVPVEVTPPPTPLLVEFEEFDYEKLRNEMADFVSEDQTVSSFVVKKDDALRIIRRANLPYLITPVSTDTYSVVLLGEFDDFSQVAQKSLYGVFVITTVSENLSKELAYDLRVAGYPSYVYAFTKGGKKYYSVVVGAFPTRNLALEYFEKLNWDDIMKRIGTNSPGYAGGVDLSLKIKREHQRIALLLALVFFILLGIVVERGRNQEEKDVPPQKVTSFPIDLNSASVEDLMSIPGIGPVKAQRIVEYRRIRGKFSTVEELTNVSGIGEKTLEKISKYVTVEGVEQPFRSEVTKLNVNTASLEELETLPYIGEAKARAIIEYREEHGPFSSPEDLLNVPGIGEKTLERIRGKITF